MVRINEDANEEKKELQAKKNDCFYYAVRSVTTLYDEIDSVKIEDV